MDIGVPLRDLGPIDVAAAGAFVHDMPAAAWQHNTFRQDVLADGVHSATQSIVFRHEWDRWTNPWRVNTIEQLIDRWAAARKIDPAPFYPTAREETDIGPVYTFPDWETYRDVLAPVVEAAIDTVRTARGIVTRLALVRLMPGGRIAAHVDGQKMAYVAHRLHVPLTAPPGVSYKIGGRKAAMKLGRVYDFNNRVRHAVRHDGRQPRVNLFIDYYATPGLYVPPAYGHH